jgi:fumarate reductase subunit C
MGQALMATSRQVVGRRPYHPPVRATWWLERRPYVFFIVRELTSVFIAAYLGLFLVLLLRLSQGPTAYEAYLDWLASPVLVAFHILALAAALYHTITWFHLTPMVMVVRLGERRVPGILIELGSYAAWIAVSLIIVWIVGHG